ncbi:MAG: ABC transporter permease [Prochlorotrichaceae cyanobacterium]|jgi:putative ABC transport system permease protein
MLSLDRKLIRDLLHLRGQVMAIVLIVACGIASMVTMLSAYDSLQLTQQTYYSQYRFGDVFVQVKRAPEDLRQRILAIPGVQQVQTRVVRDVIVDIPGLQEPATGRLISLPKRSESGQLLPLLNRLALREGRFVSPGQRDEVILSETFAAANHLTVGDSLGAIVNGRWQALRIVGLALSPEYVYEIRGTDLLPDNQRFGVMWMGREALGLAFDLEGAFNDVSLSLTPNASEPEVLFQLDRLLEQYGGLGAYGREDQISHRFLSDEITSLQATAVVMPIIFLGIAAFLLNLLLGRLVSTQRDQIAVLKAFGYSNGEVGLHYLKLVTLVVMLGGLLGLGLGLWMGEAVTRNYANYYHFPVLTFVVEPSLVIISLGVSLAAAILGAVLAVQQAIQLPPAEAMRPEPPKVFRLTVVELFGLQRFFSPAGRIILRNVERQPIKAGLNILGVALAVAILVVGHSFEDAISYLIRVQFQEIQQQDITLSFTEPLSNRAQFDLLHLSGVIRAEPFRVVPARLRFQQRTYRGGLTGLPRDSQLRRLMDRDLNLVHLPPQGILLTDKLATLLGVTPGDILTIEVLEGARPKRSVRVEGLVQEWIGVAAYMDLSALSQLLREDTTLSGAYLKVEPQALEAIYQQLKETPAVASVALRKTSVDRFQEIIMGNLQIFTSVLVIFSTVIAFGVVYNAARIALSERGRELATLRIMGFTRAEVGFILLGEQALLMGVAIPLGCWMGFGLAALMSFFYDTELYRWPLVVTPLTYGMAIAVITIAAVISGWLILRQVNQLDLVTVMKTRE